MAMQGILLICPLNSQTPEESTAAIRQKASLSAHMLWQINNLLMSVENDKLRTSWGGNNIYLKTMYII